jgi:hypothetical protein
MQSKTVKFNLFAFFTTLSLIATAYLAFPLTSTVFMALTVSVMIISQLITFLTPSGEWAFTSGDWTVGKWITRVGIAVLAIFAGLESHGWMLQLIALTTPVIEIIIRMYGSATGDQKSAARTTVR